MYSRKSVLICALTCRTGYPVSEAMIRVMQDQKQGVVMSNSGLGMLGFVLLAGLILYVGFGGGLA